MSREACFIDSPLLLTYQFYEGHPFTQQRVPLTRSLLEALGWLEEKQIQPPRIATDEELELVHEQGYIQLVKAVSTPNTLSAELRQQAYQHGLGTEDTPLFPHMHEASTLVVGATLSAVEMVMEQGIPHALNLSGGLHHALSGKASGFCIYNDCAVAIAYMRKKYDVRVLYIDTDAHHGDGVQWAFYHDPQVMTISLHETGKYLFPGTGHITERGDGPGLGFTINLPLEPYTEDESFISIYQSIITEAVKVFRPDVIITQNGADAHRWDPLTHLACSTSIYQIIPQLVHELAHQYCEGRWIATGGGGYDIYRVVPRAWTLLWGVMSEQAITQLPLPPSWLQQWQPHSKEQLPSHLFDTPFPAMPRKQEIMEKNQRTADRVRNYLQRLQS